MFGGVLQGSDFSGTNMCQMKDNNILINAFAKSFEINIIEFSVFCKPPYVLPFAFPYTISPYRPSLGLARPRKILYVYDCIYTVRRQIKEEDFQWGLFGVPSVSLLVSNE